MPVRLRHARRWRQKRARRHALHAPALPRSSAIGARAVSDMRACSNICEETHHSFRSVRRFFHAAGPFAPTPACALMPSTPRTCSRYTVATAMLILARTSTAPARRCIARRAVPRAAIHAHVLFRRSARLITPARRGATICYAHIYGAIRQIKCLAQPHGILMHRKRRAALRESVLNARPMPAARFFPHFCRFFSRRVAR